MARYDYWFWVLKRLERCGVIPTVNLGGGGNIDKVDKYVEVAKALRKGGINVIEILFRAEHVEVPQVLFEAIRAIRTRLGEDMLVGCGTLQTEADTCAAIAHGAQFVVSNTGALEVVKVSNVRGVVVIPAAETQTEVVALLPFKPFVIKLFMTNPFDAKESIERLKQFRGCYPRQEFTVTGVKSPEIARELLEAGYPFVVTGGMGAQEASDKNQWDLVKETAEKYALMVRDLRSSVKIGI